MHIHAQSVAEQSAVMQGEMLQLGVLQLGLGTIQVWVNKKYARRARAHPGALERALKRIQVRVCAQVCAEVAKTLFWHMAH